MPYDSRSPVTVYGTPCRAQYSRTTGAAQTQVRPGHRREQVMLDLVVQPAHRDIQRPGAAHVAAHQHLTREEVELRVLRDERHALVVRREHHAHVHAEQPELHGEEHERDSGREHEEDERDETREAQRQEADLDPPPARASLAR